MTYRFSCRNSIENVSNVSQLTREIIINDQKHILDLNKSPNPESLSVSGISPPKKKYCQMLKILEIDMPSSGLCFHNFEIFIGCLEREIYNGRKIRTTESFLLSFHEFLSVWAHIDRVSRWHMEILGGKVGVPLPPRWHISLRRCALRKCHCRHRILIRDLHTKIAIFAFENVSHF